MIAKPIKDFSLQDAKKLLENEIPESRVLDYKSSSPLTSSHDQDKIELVRDISSFANTSGGHLIYGIEEEGGIPKSLKGFQISDIDQFKNRLDQVLQTRIEPRLYGLEYREIPLENGNYIFIIQIPRSWNGPHAVKMKDDNSSKIYSFYGRNSASKYPYDISDIRNAFDMQNSIAIKIKNFRENQINKIYNNETPIPLFQSAKIALHIIPLTAFAYTQIHDLEPFYNNYVNYLYPLSTGYGANRRRNLDGLLIFNHPERNIYPAYIQMYRNGIIEAVDSLILKQTRDQYLQPGEIQKFYIPSQSYEVALVKALSKYLQALKFLKIQLPIFIGLSLLNIKGYYMGMDLRLGAYVENHPIDRDILFLPEIELDNLEKPSHQILKPSFDLIWNACGMPNSKNYSETDEWIHENAQ